MIVVYEGVSVLSFPNNSNLSKIDLKHDPTGSIQTFSDCIIKIKGNNHSSEITTLNTVL